MCHYNSEETVNSLAGITQNLFPGIKPLSGKGCSAGQGKPEEKTSHLLCEWTGEMFDLSNLSII